jgi:F-type H+-transporting ATPase subunit gamma
MANLRDIKRRVSSVRSTQKITRAMKMVAAAKLRRAQEAIVRARPYAHRMRDLVGALAARAENGAHPLLRKPADAKRVDIVVITGDRGLCGAFNTNVVNEALRSAREQFADDDVVYTAVGRKGRDLVQRRGCTLRSSFTEVQDRDSMDAARDIIEDLASAFAGGEIREVYCIYNEFRSAISQRVVLERLLPFETLSEDEGASLDYVYEPDAESLFDRLLMRHMNVQMQRVLLESAASEQGARMTAMDSATNNAGDMISELTLQYNRARQDAITKELIEVVSGAEAL